MPLLAVPRAHPFEKWIVYIIVYDLHILALVLSDNISEGVTVYDVPDFQIQDQKVEIGLLNMMQLFLKENKIANNLTEIDKMMAQMDSFIYYTINNTHFKYRDLLLKVGVYDVHNMLWYAYSTYSQGPNLYLLFQIWIYLLNSLI